MNLSADSQVDFEVHTDVGDDDDDDDDINAANNMAQYDDDGDQQSQLAAPAAAMGVIENDARLTPGSAATLTTAAFHGAYVTMGVAPGDGDLLPPRFNGDGKVVAEESKTCSTTYKYVYNVPKSTAAVLLRTRLTGVARKWLESIPPDSPFDDIIRRFRKRFGTNDTSRTEMLTEFWHRRQAQDEPVGVYHLTRRLGQGLSPYQVAVHQSIEPFGHNRSS